MNAALLYLYTRSLANSLRQRVVRLRRPKYLFGAIFGLLYFYFYFYRLLFLRRTGGNMSAAMPTAMGENIGALILFGAVLAFAWILPGKRTALMFSEAEIAMLFPAPLTRRSLVRYKLLTSQLGIFVFAALMTVVTGRGRTGNGWLHLAGWWVIISTFSMHRLAASFALTRLMERGMANWKRRTALIGGIAALAAALWAWRALAPPPPSVRLLAQREVLSGYLESLLLTGPGPWLLLPFRVVVRPYFAPDWIACGHALVPALCLLVLHYWWVMRADVSFEEASIALSQKHAAFVAARRKGDLRLGFARRRARLPVFRLRSTGFLPVAFVWKALLYSGGRGTFRTWSLVFASAIAIAAAWIALRPSDGLALGVCFIGTAIFLIVLLGNISSGASYLRQDLTAMDLLQTYPMRGWQAVLGQLGAQAAVGAIVQWTALLMVALGLLGMPGLIGVHSGLAMAVLGALSLIAPPFNLTMMLVPAGALLLWPGWFRSGLQTAGFESMGLRLILLLGQVFAMAFALLIPGLAAFLIWSMAQSFGWSLVWLPCAAGAAAVLLVLEAWAGIMLLGALFERFDVSAE